MKLYLQPENWSRGARSYVPVKESSPSGACLSRKNFVSAFILMTILIQSATSNHRHQNRGRDSVQLATSMPDHPAYPHLSYEVSAPGSQSSARAHSSDGSTPPLPNASVRLREGRHTNNNPQSPSGTEDGRSIFPRNVFELSNSLAQAMPDANLMSPVLDARSLEYSQETPQQDAAQFGSPSDPNLDSLEQGSGSGWPDFIPFGGGGGEDVSTLIEPSMVSSATLAGPLMTPLFEQMPNHPRGDSPPALMRRLPKLVATSGTAWQFVVPSDTFLDEDGDLRLLRSSLAPGQRPEGENTIRGGPRETIPRHLHWLQYDQSTQTLFGFPTDAQIGRHEYVLQVYDRWNLMSNETVDITVRPHQSARAFTHTITIGVEWETQKRPSMVEVLTDLVKLISEGVFNDANGRNMVVHTYKLAKAQQDPQDQTTLHSPLSISWSNSSLPVHPCDLSGIESIFRLLVDSRYISSSWSLQAHDSSELAPSLSLMKALSPDFKPSSVSFSLQAACESRKASSENAIRGPNPLDTEPRVKRRIGKIRWSLGQPIIYRVPNNVFIASNGTEMTNNLSLALHTIDGKTLDQDPSYDFLEFDQDNQTIFGLPYDLTRHVGQRELLLTARNPATNQVTRETFVLDIEPQDLTTINNRAFRMSLYFLVRTNTFGARERVQIARRMISALQLGDLKYDHDQESPEFTVIDIQRFAASSSLENSAALNDPANSWRYQDKIYLVDDEHSQVGHRRSNHDEGLYKFTWTNESIGFRGECPVEVIKENILYALERSMIDYVPATEQRFDDSAKNDSVRFYERLRCYFEPELDLIHLRFEPLGACTDALELHDVGNSEVADSIDKAGDMEPTPEPAAPTPHIRSTEVATKTRDLPPVNSDEYWAIVVLIILVVAIIFVVMMLFMGLHTYRINQEKRFELQLKLAQARRNSMYLSSMMLADHQSAYASEMLSQQTGFARPAYVDERSARKPAILEAEKEFLANGHSSVLPMYKPTSVQLTGDSVQTLPLGQNTTFTVDSPVTNMQSNAVPKFAPNTMVANQQMFADARHQSMTLNRRAVAGHSARVLSRQGSMNQLSQSQSILTVASLGQRGAFVAQSQAAMPFVYAPMPVFYGPAAEEPRKA